MIFTDQIIRLETSNYLPRFFTTSLTNEMKVSTYLHCLFIYDYITPGLIDSSKSRVLSNKFFHFVQSEKDTNDNMLHYSCVPIVICIRSKHNFIDFFRKILKSLYLHMVDIGADETGLSSAMKSLEFLKYACILLNDCIVPTSNINFSLKLGKHVLPFPFSSKEGMSHNESAVATIVDLIDISNIIDI